jgi:hypothetical protein
VQAAAQYHNPAHGPRSGASSARMVGLARRSMIRPGLRHPVYALENAVYV